jgi:hypothetical protein
MGFADHAVSVVTTQLCQCYTKGALNNMQTIGLALLQHIFISGRGNLNFVSFLHIV